ncbi:hypothetical protein GGU11DRAFT_743756 [Lentinula aff. detonsa]|nr:hypothetical protein GGU11DRAFT_743756 [Lentinula aff. detonsa]
MFFGSSKWEKRIQDERSTISVSFIPEEPLELEVLKAMVAMTTCMIHAVLSDHTHSAKKENFPLTGFYQQ